MSGHSHFATIKHKKGLADAKRGQVFSKLTKELTVAAKDGTDPETNPRLRSVVDKARQVNMPSDNIDRAIKKGSGEDAGQLEEMLLETYGPGNIAILISAITDNRNRTLGEIKQILSKYKGKLVEGGGVQWLFERRGVITVESKQEGSAIDSPDEIELLAIEIGADDTYWHDGALDVYADPTNFNHIIQTFEQKGLSASSSLDWIPKKRIQITSKNQESAEKLFEALDDNDDVQDIYSNI